MLSEKQILFFEFKVGSVDKKYYLNYVKSKYKKDLINLNNKEFNDVIKFVENNKIPCKTKEDVVIEIKEYIAIQDIPVMEVKAALKRYSKEKLSDFEIHKLFEIQHKLYKYVDKRSETEKEIKKIAMDLEINMSLSEKVLNSLSNLNKILKDLKLKRYQKMKGCC